MRSVYSRWFRQACKALRLWFSGFGFAAVGLGFFGLLMNLALCATVESLDISRLRIRPTKTTRISWSYQLRLAFSKVQGLEFGDAPKPQGPQP